MSYIAVALGGALGAVSRHWIYGAFLRFSEGRFPFATLTVNIVGSLLLGIGFVLLVEKAHFDPNLKALLNVGFLGAFTTFSTFSLDTIGMLEMGEYTSALVYILSSVLVCLLAAWLGIAITRSIA